MNNLHISGKKILWDHSSLDLSELCHPLMKRKLRVIVKDRIIGLAARTLESQETDECILLGSINADKNGEGLVVTVDRFEEHQRQTLLLPGDVQVPVWFSKKTKKAKGKLVEDYLQDLKLLTKNYGGRFEVDLSNVMKIDVQCNVEGPQCSLKVEAIMPSTTFKVIPIHSIPVSSTALYNSLSNSSRQALYKSGLLTIDQSRKVIYLLENDPRISSTQLVGIWVSGVDMIHHPYIWAACLRYLNCSDYVFRMCLPPKPFLVSLFKTTTLEPEYYDCFALKENDFELLTGCCNLTVTKIPSYSSHITVTDLSVENESENFHLFSNAKLMFRAKRNEKMESQKPEVDIQSNVDDFPRTIPRAQQLHDIDFNPLVPDLSLLSESGYGISNKLAIHHGLSRKFPLQTLDVNVQQFNYSNQPNKSSLLAVHNANPKTNHRRTQFNDENEPIPLEEAPNPLLANSHIPLASNDRHNPVVHSQSNSAHLTSLAPPPNIAARIHGLNACNNLNTPKRCFDSTNTAASARSRNTIQNAPCTVRSILKNDATSCSNPLNLHNHIRLLDKRRKSFPVMNGPLTRSEFGNNNRSNNGIPLPSRMQNDGTSGTLYARRSFTPGDHLEICNGLPSVSNMTSPFSSKDNNSDKLCSAEIRKPPLHFNTVVHNINQNKDHTVNSGNAISNPPTCWSLPEQNPSEIINLQEVGECISDQNEKHEVFPVPFLNHSNRNIGNSRDNGTTDNVTSRGNDEPSPTNGDRQEILNQKDSFEIQMMIEEQDSKLRKLQEQIQELFEARTPVDGPEKKTNEETHAIIPRDNNSTSDEKSEIYHLLKQQDQQLQRLQEQINSVLQLHQSSPVNKPLQDSGLGSSPDVCQNVGVLQNERVRCKNTHCCENTATKCNPACCRSHCCTPNGLRKHCEKTSVPASEKCTNCSPDAAGSRDLSLHLSNLNMQTVYEPPPSLPPSVLVDMNDFAPSCLDNGTSSSASDNDVTLSDKERDHDSCNDNFDASCGEEFCQELLGNINYVLEKQMGTENPAITENGRYGLQSFLLPSLNYQTMHLSHLDSDLGDLAMKYLGEQKQKATRTSTKMFLEHKVIRNNEQQQPDTSVCGLSSNNISYATQMYLERHGLASSTVARTQKQLEEESIWIFSEYRKGKSSAPFLQKNAFDGREVDSSNVIQVLDMQALRRKPKLL